MEVTVDILGEGERTVAVDGSSRPTYGDLLDQVGLSPQEAAVLVDGQPVPEASPIDVERVRILRMIRGGTR